eukprot:491548-Pelagomonas_calceolata.AAC.1
MKEFVQVRMPIPILVCKRTMLSTSILVLTLNTFFHHQAALLSLDAPGGEELVGTLLSGDGHLFDIFCKDVAPTAPKWRRCTACWPGKSDCPPSCRGSSAPGSDPAVVEHEREQHTTGAISEKISVHTVSMLIAFPSASLKMQVLAQHLDLCKVATSLDNLQGFLAMAMPQFDCVAVIGPLEAWLTILQPICLHGNCEHIGLYNFLLAPFQESHQAPPEAAPATAQQTRAWHPTSWCATSFAVRNLKVHCFA